MAAGCWMHCRAVVCRPSRLGSPHALSGLKELVYLNIHSNKNIVSIEIADVILSTHDNPILIGFSYRKELKDEILFSDKNNRAIGKAEDEGGEVAAEDMEDPEEENVMGKDEKEERREKEERKKEEDKANDSGNESDSEDGSNDDNHKHISKENTQDKVNQEILIIY